MISSEREFKVLLTQSLAAELDAPLAARGFTRGAGLVDYLRIRPECEQCIRVYYEFRPRYDSGADAHVYPQLKLRFPEVNRLAKEMSNRDDTLSVEIEATLSQPMEWTIPSESQQQRYVSGKEGILECVKSIKHALEAWALPFLDEHSTVTSFIAAYESRDKRIGWHRNLFLYVGAAYVCVGQPDKALKMLEREFSRPGAKRKISKAFDFVVSKVVKQE